MARKGPRAIKEMLVPRVQMVLKATKAMLAHRVQTERASHVPAAVQSHVIVATP
jgi:hypothetical protein